MLQINYIKQHTALVKEKLAVKNFGNIELVDELLQLDEELRKQKTATETLQASLNAASKEIGMLMGKGEATAAENKKQEAAKWRDDITANKTALDVLEETFNAKILLLPNLPHTSVPKGKTPEDIISEMYVRCFSRRPIPEEVASLLVIVAEQENKKEALEDIFWSLLNSSEFLFNH